MNRKYADGLTLRQWIQKRDNNTCQKCGRKDHYREFHVDHIIPKSKGGKSEPENLQLLCPSCNTKKGNKMP